MDSQLLLIVVMLVVFYFLLIRPQQKRVAAHRTMVDAIKVGDEITTVGGIFATVVEVGARLRVRTVDGSELEIAPAAVGQVLAAQDAPTEAEPVPHD